MARSKSSRKPSHLSQRDLFGEVLKEAHLHAPDSPRKAFYRLWFEKEFDQYVIRKESGFGDKVLDRREWRFESLELFEKDFEKRLNQKTRPDRKKRQSVDEK